MCNKSLKVHFRLLITSTANEIINSTIPNIQGRKTKKANSSKSNEQNCDMQPIHAQRQIPIRDTLCMVKSNAIAVLAYGKSADKTKIAAAIYSLFLAPCLNSLHTFATILFDFTLFNITLYC